MQTYFKLNRLPSALQAFCTTTFQSEHATTCDLKEKFKIKRKEDSSKPLLPKLDHIQKQASNRVIDTEMLSQVLS